MAAAQDAPPRIAGLRYVNDGDPGISRRRFGPGFRYVDADGRPVRDRDTLRRIRALAIPPAWTDVWICAHADGHIQAVGRDARGRKQYRYHARWRAAKDEAKYNRMIAFGHALSQIRAAADRDMSLPGLPRRKVLATAVRLLETSLIRVGNDEYARANGSFGLTTLRDKHVAVEGGTVRFRFRGKSGVRHAIEISDPRIARIVKRCQDLPGQKLFQYVDEDGAVRDISSDDVNAYIRETAGDEFSAKDFRTWAGTVLAAMALREFEVFDSEIQAKKNIMSAIKAVAKRLGNTPTVCRQCYVHPHILDSYLDGTLLETLRQRANRAMDEVERLRPEEAAVLALLRRRLARVEQRVSARRVG